MYLFLILNFWHQLFDIKMTRFKPDLTNGMLFCVHSAKIPYNSPSVTQRLSLDMVSYLPKL